MHQLVLITAVSAASGLFATRSQCPNGQCGAAWTYASPAPVAAQFYWPATVMPAAPAQAPHAGYVYSSGYAGYAPAPIAPIAPTTAYAPPVYAPAPYANVPAGYMPAVSGCATGNCPRR